jgi:hypothetical protein
MARPKKNNADYFPHDADMRNDPKIRALRRKFGLDGYAIWNMFLEALTNSDFFEHEWNKMNIELLSGDFEIDPIKLQDILTYCEELKLINIDNESIYCQKLIDRFESVLERRKRQRQSTIKDLSTSITHFKEVSNSQKSQSKVKEKKVNTLEEYSEQEFLDDWNNLRLEYLKKPSFLNLMNKIEDRETFKELKQNYSREDFQNALVGLFKQKKFPDNNKSMQSNPSHFLKYFNSYLTAFHDRNTNLYGQETKQLI